VAERLGREPKPLGPEALATLTRHAWPGNVRELRNVLEQAAVLAAGEIIEVGDLHLQGRATTPEPGAPLADGMTFGDAKRHTIESFERDFLLRALRDNEGNVSRAAQSIGMVRQSLQQKIRELDLRSEDWGKGKNGNGK
jgi:DNA-binding NtrC family response regulator